MIDTLIYISVAIGYGRWCYQHWNTIKSHPIHRFDLVVSLIGTTIWMTHIIISQSISPYSVIMGFAMSLVFGVCAIHWKLHDRRQIRHLMEKQQWNMTLYFAEQHVRRITNVLFDQSMILFFGSVMMCAWFPMIEAEWHIILRTWFSRILWVSLVWGV